ncbi:MAG: DEAD/DEAH box helicase, partial [Candidatus Micrarchaeota archaeon]
MGFDKLGIKPELLKAVTEAGFSEPTPIQEHGIPVMLSGKDVIAQAQTGTGKTAAFAIGILQKLDAAKHVEAIVLVPTRELALQVVTEVKMIGKHSRHSVVAVYGGESIERQIRELAHGAQVVVGTPGRLLDHLERRTLDLSKVKIVVLDEADRMLDMGFIDDVKRILMHAPQERQTMLFSATMPGGIVGLAKQTMHDPVVVNVSEDKIAVDKIKQFVVVVDPRDKVSAILALLKLKKPAKAIVFCRTKYGAERLYHTLERHGYRAISLHGNLTQSRREKSLDEFRATPNIILVATDIAARGLDIVDNGMVINYDLPEEPDAYVHRIGRTARAGHEGEAVSIAGSIQEKNFVMDASYKAGSTVSEIQLDYHKRPESDYRGHGNNPYGHFEDDRRYGVAPAGRAGGRYGGARGGGQGSFRGGGDRGGRPREGGFHSRPGGDSRGGGGF